MQENELITNLKRTYFLANALNLQLDWIKTYTNNEFRKKVNHAMFANKNIITHIEKNLTPEQIKELETIYDGILDKIWEEIKD